MKIIVAAFELAGADAQEGDAVPVLWVHVRVDLEDESCEFILLGLYDPHGCLARCRIRRNADKGVE